MVGVIVFAGIDVVLVTIGAFVIVITGTAQSCLGLQIVAILCQTLWNSMNWNQKRKNLQFGGSALRSRISNVRPPAIFCVSVLNKLPFHAK